MKCKARIIRVFEQGFWDRRGWGDDSHEVWVSGYHSWHVWLDGQQVGSFEKWRAAFDSAFNKVTALRLSQQTDKAKKIAAYYGGLTKTPFNHLGVI